MIYRFLCVCERSCWVAPAGLELTEIGLCLFPTYWDERNVPQFFFRKPCLISLLYIFQYLFLQPSFCKIRIHLFLFSQFHRWKHWIPCILLSTSLSTPKCMGGCSLSGLWSFFFMSLHTLLHAWTTVYSTSPVLVRCGYLYPVTISKWASNSYLNYFCTATSLCKSSKIVG